MDYNQPSQLSVERRHFILGPENYVVDVLEDDDQFERDVLQSLEGNIQFYTSQHSLSRNLTL